MRRLVDSSRIVVLRLLFFVALVGCGDGSSTPQSVPNPLLAGPYPVGVTRIELFDASQGRTQLTEIWYPAAESARGQEPAPLGSYLPEGLEALADNATVPLVAVRDAELAGDSPFAFTDDLRTWDIVNGYSAAFFGRYIKGITSYEEILVSNLDPEVTVFTADP